MNNRRDSSYKATESNGQSRLPTDLRELTHDLDAERAVLGSMLLDASAIAIARRHIKSKAEFWNERYGQLFQSLCDLEAAGKPIDSIVLAAELGQSKFDSIGGYDLLVECNNAVPSWHRVSAYAEIVHRHWLTRTRFTMLCAMSEKVLTGGDIRGELESLNSLTAQVPDDDLSPVAVTDLLARKSPRRETVIENVLRKCEAMNIVGGAKSRKSYLALDLALAVATGSPWLNFQTHQGRVLLVDNELYSDTIEQRIPLVANARALLESSYAGNLEVVPLRESFRDHDIYSLGPLFDRTKGRFSLVIIDALYKLYPSGMSENDNAAMGRLYSQISRYAKLMNAGFVVVHHTSKGDQSGKEITDLGAGAGSLSRACDAHLGFRKHQEDNCVVAGVEFRDWAPIEPFVMRWTYPVWTLAPEYDAQDLYRPSKPTPKPKPPESIDEQIRDFVIECFTTKPRGKESIRRQSQKNGWTEREFRELLPAAVDDGLVAVGTEAHGKKVYSVAMVGNYGAGVTGVAQV